MNQWAMLVVPNTAVVWPSRKKKKKGKGLCQLSKGLPHSAGHWGGPPLLLHSGRRDFFRPQGDRGPGGVGLHCAWPGQPGWGSACSGGPSAQMSAHAERTLESDGKKKKEKENQGLYGKRTPIWPLGNLLNTNCRFRTIKQWFFIFFCTKMYCCQKLEGFEGECTRRKKYIYMKYWCGYGHRWPSRFLKRYTLALLIASPVYLCISQLYLLLKQKQWSLFHPSVITQQTRFFL